MMPAREEIVRFARCLATDPPTPCLRGCCTTATGRMPCGTRVQASYYNWNEDITTLSRLRIYARESDGEEWHFVEGFNLDPPVRTV